MQEHNSEQEKREQNKVNSTYYYILFVRWKYNIIENIKESYFYF